MLGLGRPDYALIGMTRMNKCRNFLAVVVSACACIGISSAEAQTVVEYIHTDALGTPIAVTDANRNVIERSEYEPFGQLLNRALSDGPGFTGHVQDAATGLTYMQQRYYDPLLGRFLSVDPVTASSSTGGNFNRYWYANNNPYRFSDPDGRKPQDEEEKCETMACNQERQEERRRKREQPYAPTTSSPAQRLAAVTVDGPSKSANGAVRWEIRWDLSMPSTSGGWVVQRMQISSGGTYVNGETETNPGRPYWEAWRVEPGQSSATGTDTFRRGAVDAGIIKDMYMKWNGSARFYEGLVLPKTFVWGRVPSAGHMMSTYEDPKLPLEGATEPVDRVFDMSFP
jgi:RHS repeat-associated protein